MSKYDKELDTRTKEYEEATKPAPREAKKEQPKGEHQPIVRKK